VEGSSDGGWIGTFDGGGDVGVCRGVFVPDEDCQSAEMTVILRFDSYLYELVFV